MSACPTPAACSFHDACLGSDEELLAEKDALDRISLEQSFTTDPVERLIGDALTAAGFEWKHECHPSRNRDPVRLDFAVEGGPYIEVKRFHAERCGKQLAQAPEVILIQGMAAARWFANALAAGSRRAKTPQAVECEASQSGPQGQRPNPEGGQGQHPVSNNEHR